MGQLIDYEVAIERRRNKNGSWKHARDRMLDEVWPVMAPSFELTPGGKIFTIGSCFARNIEEHLQRLGFQIPMLSFRVPAEEWPARANGILNKYTPPAIFQEIDWAKKIFIRDGIVRESDCDAFLFECDANFCVDTNLGGFGLVSRRRFLERRCQIYEVFRELFTSECVVMTLGLIEAWFDRDKGAYIQEIPVGKTFSRKANRFAFEVLNFDQCRDYVQRSVDAVREINKNAKFLITTSPVPLSRTFTADDVITANMQSKSVLRAVAGDVAAANALMDYFPSYESVVGTKSWQVWCDDLIHVSDTFVGKVVSRLTDIYCPSVDESRRKYLDFYVGTAGDNLDKALELGSQILDENVPEYHSRMSQVWEQKGDIAAAVKELEKAIAVKPADCAFRFQLSKLLAQLNRVEEAIVQARNIIKLDPSNVLYRRHLASLCARNRDFSQAISQRVLAGIYRWQHKTRNAKLKRFLQVIVRRSGPAHKS